MDEVKLLPCLDDDVRRRLLSVATTLETCGKHGIPIDFAMLAHDIRAAIEATRPPIVTDEVVERDDATLLVPRKGLEDALFDSLYDSCELMGVATRKAAKGCVAAIEAHAAALPTIDQDGGE